MKHLLAIVLAASSVGVLDAGGVPPAPASQQKAPATQNSKDTEGPIEELPQPRQHQFSLRIIDPSILSEKILSPVVEPIDLATALRLAGVQNPAILLARERVVTAVVLRQLAAAEFLPTLNAGLNYDSHTGPLQQSSGNILKENRQALYIGAGANAVAAGTVAIPGVVFNYNVSQAIFGYLASKQLVAARRFASRAAQNEGLRKVASAYVDLLNAEAHRAVVYEIRKKSGEAKRLCDAQAKTGLGRQGDADRATNEYADRTIELVNAERQVQLASAKLCELINLDPATRLHPIEERLVPMPVVPDPIPLNQLLAIALIQRPEVGQYQALLRQAMLQLTEAKLLPFSPNLIVGFSAGTFGGGSNLITGPGSAFGAPPFQSRFGTFGPRNDFDAIMYWTAQNLGVGNWALINQGRAKLSISDLQRLDALNKIRMEVADAYIRTHVRFAQIAAAENGIRAGEEAFREDYYRVENKVQKAIPYELLESVKLLYRARTLYVDAIADYNRAQLDLYVALGQPPADSLARPVARRTVELGAVPVEPAKE